MLAAKPSPHHILFIFTIIVIIIIIIIIIINIIIIVVIVIVTHLQEFKLLVYKQETSSTCTETGTRLSLIRGPYRKS